jgi:carbamoyltransferase|tara:strand:+ start:8465 stop:8989 length:525 start_codon:yes stop_codon:yes gene_type:complete
MNIIKDVNEAVDLILQQKPLVIFQGSSEWGPRALGNRSILFDPRNKNAKDIVNEFKQREWWRPLAASVLLEHAHDWFDLATLKESPYMTFAVGAKKKAIKYTPSIVHVDDSCRIQTVTSEQNKNYYDLINVFYKKTEVPLLLNTSFNLAGYPIAESIEDVTNLDIPFKDIYMPK